VNNGDMEYENYSKAKIPARGKLKS
jgi:hypothetical protein